jgi:hypothetical protein
MLDRMPLSGRGVAGGRLSGLKPRAQSYQPSGAKAMDQRFEGGQRNVERLSRLLLNRWIAVSVPARD